MNPEESFTQLHLRFTDPVQYDCEVIRPIMLCSKSVADRSLETETPRTTVREKAKQFVQEGMLGLVNKRSNPSAKREIGFPVPIAKYILHLKHLSFIEKLYASSAKNMGTKPIMAK